MMTLDDAITYEVASSWWGHRVAKGRLRAPVCRLFARLAARKHARYRAIAASLPVPPAPPAPAATAWQALPGQRLALGATGFEIAFDQRGSPYSYLLISPEGRELAKAVDGFLDQMKKHAEALAAERAQLECSGAASAFTFRAKR